MYSCTSKIWYCTRYVTAKLKMSKNSVLATNSRVLFVIRNYSNLKNMRTVTVVHFNVDA